MIKKCESCGDNFSTNYKWATVCKDCYVDKKKAEHQDLIEQVGYWRERAISAEQKLVCMVSIDPEMMRRLIFLAHPDKHNQSESSRIATQWLLEKRGS